MKYVLKLWCVIILPRCVCSDPKEDIDLLVCESGKDSSQVCKHISVNVTWRNGDLDFLYKNEKINGQDTHIFQPTGSNKITSIYKDTSLIWQAYEGVHCKLIHARKPIVGNYTVILYLVINGKDVTKTFDCDNGFFYENGTISLNINKEEAGDGYKFDNQVVNKNGEIHWTVDKGKKITLVMHKSTGSNARLFWQSNGIWHCTKVTATKESDKINKMVLEITDGSNSTKLVLIKQGKKTWVPENTVSLNTKKEGQAPNCKYTSQVQNKNGKYFYEPIDGFTIMRVSHGSKSKLENLVWQSPGNHFCTKVTGTKESDKTTSFLLDLKDDKETKFQKKFELQKEGWVEAPLEDEKKTSETAQQ